MSDALLPCPHCGMDARIFSYDTEIDAWPIKCLWCTASVYSKHSEDDAIARWNRRTEQSANPVGAQWKPLIDGSGDFGTHTISVEASGAGLVLRSKATGKATNVALPGNIRLCRLTQQKGNSNE